jgi:uncharacterized membrane protein
METSPWAIVVVAICAVMGSVAQFLFKTGSATLEVNFWSLVTNIKIMGGMGLYGFSAILFVFALKHGHLSVLYPIVATSYIWVALISAKYLGEPLSILKSVGCVLILGGIILIARS